MTTATSSPAEKAMNPEVLDALLGKMVYDMGAAINGALILLGDRLGIYKTLWQTGPVTTRQLAEATELDERQLREWLSAQAASGYITYDRETQRFALSPEQAAVFADPDSPAAMTGAYYSIAAAYHDEPLVEESFRTGRGVGWGDHHNCLFCGTEWFFRPGYKANLVSNWIPAIDGVEAQLREGIRVADVGCGLGSSTLILAEAFPNSQFVGFDLHPASIEGANRHAIELGLTNVRFEIGTAQAFPGTDYGFITMFDALHDMGDPVGAARHIGKALRPGGVFMVVEPRAGDTLEENLNAVGSAYYGFSTMICTPGALSQPGGEALGAQAGDREITRVLREGGFQQVRRATETPFNVVMEARL